MLSFTENFLACFRFSTCKITKKKCNFLFIYIFFELY